MRQRQFPSQLDHATIVEILEVVEQKMQNQECFFALDVTNEVKQRGYKMTPPGNFGSHSAMAPVVRDHAQAVAAQYNYAWAILDVGNGDEQAWLYFPHGTATATIQSHVNRRVTPLIPVEVWAQQVSQQGSGIQSQAVGSSALPTATPVPSSGGKTLGQHILGLLGRGV